MMERRGETTEEFMPKGIMREHQKIIDRIEALRKKFREEPTNEKNSWGKAEGNFTIKCRRKGDKIEIHFKGSMNAILMVNSHRPRCCIVNGKEIRELFTLEDLHSSNAGFIYDSSQGKVCIKPGVKRALIVLEYSEGQH